MIQTLEAIIDQRGQVRLLQPVQLPGTRRALVTILEDRSATAAEDQSRATEQGKRMAEALTQLAALHAMADVLDPVAWEREVRLDRELPDREA